MLRTCCTAVRLLVDLYVDNLLHTFCLCVRYCDMSCDWLQRYKPTTHRNLNHIADICCEFVEQLPLSCRFVVDFVVQFVVQ